MRAYDLLINASAGPTITFPSAGNFEQSPAALEQPSPATKSKKKRPAPGQDLSTPADRTIQAQPFPTVNTPGDPVRYQAAVGSSQAAEEQPQKKRGRPNKEEHERRVREAAQRGEIYPPPKKVKTARHSLEGTAGAALSGMMEDGSTGRKKAKKSRAAPTTGNLAPEIPERTSSLEAPTSGADQMQIEAEKYHESAISKPQVSNSLVQEGRLLAGVQEHPAVTTQDGPSVESSTVESSSTLKPDLALGSEQNLHAATSHAPMTTT